MAEIKALRVLPIVREHLVEDRHCFFGVNKLELPLNIWERSGPLRRTMRGFRPSSYVFYGSLPYEGNPRLLRSAYRCGNARRFRARNRAHARDEATRRAEADAL